MVAFRIFFVVTISLISHCFSIEKASLFEAIERRDVSGVVNFFDKLEAVTLEEASELVAAFHEHYRAQFGSEIFDNEEYIKNLENWKEVYHSILEKRGIKIENNLIRYDNDGSKSILLCSKKQKNAVAAEIPGSIILGGVEILGGALVWILPFAGAKLVGGAMISDGIRRTFNGLEEIEEDNRKNQ